MKTYSELITLPTFEERFYYLLLQDHAVGEDTFGHARYLNQKFYHSTEWRRFRRDMIVRDYGCEMALKPYEITGSVILHHLNPLDEEDIINNTEALMNPENTVCVSLRMHNAIHYGDLTVLEPCFYTREKGDTKLW